MKRHDTPLSVAEQLTKHIPSVLKRVLDPAVGSGSLIWPICSELRQQQSKLVFVDIDKAAIQSVKSDSRFSELKSAELICRDFLEWSLHPSIGAFDCIVMNPPFAACRNALRCIRQSSFVERDRLVPVEAAFLCRAVDMLEDGGRLLAVLPGSIIMAMGLRWLRQRIFEFGAVRLVHELPPRSFPRVESRMYLFVFDKAKRQRKVQLMNHDLIEPEILKVEIQNTSIRERLDFGFHSAKRRLETMKSYSRLGWFRLGELAEIFRGTVPTPVFDNTVVHTTDYNGSGWTKKCETSRSNKNVGRMTLNKTDLLLKRVGRDSYRSIGTAKRVSGRICSDCVLVIRPADTKEHQRLLFALKILFSLKWTKPLIERGTGASYISIESLKDLVVPFNAYKVYPGCFSKFLGEETNEADSGEKTAISKAVLQILSKVDL